MAKTLVLRDYSIFYGGYSETTVLLLREIKAFANLPALRPALQSLPLQPSIYDEENIVKLKKIRAFTQNHDIKPNGPSKSKLVSEAQRRNNRKLKAVLLRQARV